MNDQGVQMIWFVQNENLYKQNKKKNKTKFSFHLVPIV